MSQSSSRHAVVAPASPLLRILVTQLGAPESFAAKPLETSSGPSQTRVFLIPSTNSPCHLQTLQIFPCFKFPSPTRMLRFGVCSILPMRDTIYHPSGLNSERSRRIPCLPTGQKVVEPGSVSLEEVPKKKPCGRLSAKVTRIVSNGLSCVQLSISLSKPPPLASLYATSLTTFSDEIIKAAEKNGPVPNQMARPPVSLRDPGSMPGSMLPQPRPGVGPPRGSPQHMMSQPSQRPPLGNNYNTGRRPAQGQSQSQRP